MRKKQRIARIAVLLTALVALTALAIAGNYLRSSAPPPDAGAELKEFYKRYLADTLVNMTGVIRLYDKEANNTLKEENTLCFIRQGNRVYTRISYLETFISDGLAVELDTVNQYIVVARRGKQVAPAAGPFQLLDSLFSSRASFRLEGSVTLQGNERSLRLRSDYSPEIKSCVITYDSSSYRVKSTAIEWWKEGVALDKADANRVWEARIEYEYHPFSVLNVDERIHAIITIHGGQIQPTEKYANYQVYNRL